MLSSSRLLWMITLSVSGSMLEALEFAEHYAPHATETRLVNEGLQLPVEVDGVGLFACGMYPRLTVGERRPVPHHPVGVSRGSQPAHPSRRPSGSPALPRPCPRTPPRFLRGPPRVPRPREGGRATRAPGPATTRVRAALRRALLRARSIASLERASWRAAGSVRG